MPPFLKSNFRLELCVNKSFYRVDEYVIDQKVISISQFSNKLPNMSANPIEEIDNKKLNRFLSAFDLDHTLLNVNSSFSFGHYLYKKNHLSFPSFLFILINAFYYNLGLLSLKRLHEKAFKYLFLKKAEVVVKKWVSEFLNEHLKDMLDAKAIQKLEQAQQDGHITALLSNSPAFLVEPIAEQLKFSFWEASSYHLDSVGCYSSISKINEGLDKAVTMKALQKAYSIELDHTYAYSDSHIDLPFLLTAGHIIVVNPTRNLRRLANKNNWSIIN